MADAAEVPPELLDVVEEGFSRVVRQLHERHERFRDEQRKMWERRKAAREESPEDLEELADRDHSPLRERSSDEE